MTTLLMCCCENDDPCVIESYVNTAHGCGCYDDMGCEDGDAVTNCLSGETFTVKIATVRTSSWGQVVPDCSNCDSCPGDDCCCDNPLGGCNCLHFYSAQTETITIDSFEHVNSAGCGAVYEATVPFTIPKSGEHNDDPDDLAGEPDTTECCSAVNATDWPLDDDCAYFGCLGGNKQGHPYYERGVRTPYFMADPDTPGYYEHVSYSNQIPDRDGVILSLVFRIDQSGSYCRMFLAEVHGPVGFDYNETFNEDGVIYKYGGGYDQDWPVPDRGQARILMYEQRRDGPPSAQPCYCGWCPSTNVFGESMSWQDPYHTCNLLDDGVQYWETTAYTPLLYQTWAQLCAPGCEFPDHDCSGYMRLRVHLGPIERG